MISLTKTPTLSTVHVQMDSNVHWDFTPFSITITMVNQMLEEHIGWKILELRSVVTEEFKEDTVFTSTPLPTAQGISCFSFLLFFFFLLDFIC